HAVFIRYFQDGGNAEFTWLWQRGSGRFNSVAPWALRPRRIGYTRFVMDRALEVAAASAIWIALPLALAAAFGAFRPEIGGPRAARRGGRRTAGRGSRLAGGGVVGGGRRGPHGRGPGGGAAAGGGGGGGVAADGGAGRGRDALGWGGPQKVPADAALPVGGRV